MIDYIEAIQAAISPSAAPEQRATGAAACRAILATLEPPPAPSAAAAPAMPPIGELVAALRGMPTDQLLDVAIARLRAALPADAAVTPVRPFKLPIVPVPVKKTL